MQFQPSQYSHYGTYDGRIGDWWEEVNKERKEKKAKRKTKRAETLKKKAERGGVWAKSREKRAGRKDVKAAELRDVKQIHPSIANAAKLWRVKYPWAERKKMGPTSASRALNPLAEGRRPASRLRDSEQRATIYGGINALYAAGVAPYTSFTQIETIPFKAEGKEAKSIDSTLIGWAKSAARTAGKPAPKNLKEAAEFIRQEAINQNLEEAAWGARALALLEQSVRRNNISAASSAAAAPILGATSSALTAASASPPWVQSVVTLPAAFITGVAAWVSTANAGKAKVQGAFATGKYEEFRTLFEGAFSSRAAADQQLISQNLDRQLAARDRVQTKLLSDLEAGQREGIEKGVKLLTYSIGAGVALMLTSYVVGKRRRA